MRPNLHSPERQLIEWRIEYADLVALLEQAAQAKPVDQLLLLRLHKRQAVLQAEIARLECLLDPDEPA